MGTTTAGLPYPEPADPVASYPGPAKTVAEAVPAVAGGTVSVSLSAQFQNFVVVTFPAGRFTVTPKVTLATSTDSNYIGLAAVPTVTNMRVYAKQWQGTAITASVLVSWMAAMGGPIS